MEGTELIERFVKSCPFAVLTQAAIRATIGDELDKVFHSERSQQYEGEVLFSDVALTVADIALGFAENPNQAYKTQKENLGVSLTSFYNKMNATEPPISEGVVRRSAERATEMIDELECPPWEVLRGYRVFALDGNHQTDKRLEPLRDAFDAPLPGTVVARFDLQRQLFDRAYLLEDAHAQESSVKDRVVADLEPDDVIIADRHYCVLHFLRRIDEAQAAFAIRQHGRFKGILIGKRRRIGRISAGVVYEQEIRTSDRDDAFSMRRITLELDAPTRDGDTVIHVLTNLPARIAATLVAALYGLRWEEEIGFYYLTTTLTCELPSLGQPRAALFLFCMAMLAFNLRQVMFAALYAEHDEEEVNEVSHFHVSVEVSRFTDGMLAVIDEQMWEQWIHSRRGDVAHLLREIARSINIREYRKSRRGPKKNKEPPERTRPKTHLSTAKALAAARETP
jgi:hypothetical protein